MTIVSISASLNSISLEFSLEIQEDFNLCDKLADCCSLLEVVLRRLAQNNNEKFHK